ncbi:hypothetical protein [Hymenobacter cellulosilyticus]|uniref:Lipoprotein n=1 Tax=Hymenobacter cellulosilyticus TaxID=2932248 RepID=A0A8T9Q3E2_9BACT|nr:hypothetical protein [Hymenobacter cellulosilyticus]UOQ71565.1 hypothetical protein MUN79_23580 [Hymenobacter cellulosilyticus]
MKTLFTKAALLATGLTLSALTGCDKTAEQLDVAPKAAAQSADATAAFKASLALRWAPVHYQDTDVTGDHGLSGKGDYITAINFDGDWSGTNNWNNLASRAATAHGYYSVVETGTHWFITYAFFHPRDWTDNVLLYNIDEHENDLEGLLAVVRKDGSTYGNLQGIVTVAHSDFYSFVPAGSPLQANQEDVDGSLTMEQFNGGLHPVTAQEAKGTASKPFRTTSSTATVSSTSPRLRWPKPRPMPTTGTCSISWWTSLSPTASGTSASIRPCLPAPTAAS